MKPLQFVAKTVLILSINLLLAPLPVWSQAQEPATAAWETDAPPEGGWTVGGVIPLRLRVVHPADVEVTLPELPSQWGPFEVRDQTPLPSTRNDDGTWATVVEMSVALWAPGEYETAPLTVSYQGDDGTRRELPVPPLSIAVGSVLSENDLEKRDLKPQASLPRPPVWPWVLLGLLIAVSLFLALRWLRSRRRARTEPADTVPVDDRRPEEIAYEELARIAALDLPAQGEFKRHYTLVTDCVRIYIEGVYDIRAMDRTTGELIAAVPLAWMSREAAGGLRELLVHADLVKFAKLRPSIDQARATVLQARRFVDMTKPERTSTDETQEPGDAEGPGG